MRKGFTLIEMMIVVAIIAIIAAIAIPSLLAARRSSLETNAVGSCRAYAEAQSMYHRNDWTVDGHGTAGVLEYAVDPAGTTQGFVWLNGEHDNAGATIQLIDTAFAAAIAGGPPKHGYNFQDLVNIDMGPGAVIINPVTDFGLCALPNVYGRTGYRTFIIMTNGTTFGQDQGPAGTFLATYPPDPMAQVPPWIIAE